MIYYHGTDVYFTDLMLPTVESYKDFGMGVYLAEREEHARRVAYWKRGAHAYVYKYQVNITELKKRYNIKVFRTISIEWVKYIIHNRTSYGGYDYDAIIGPTADNDAQGLVEKFIRDYPTPKDSDYRLLIDALMPLMSNGVRGHGIQMCIKSQELLNEFNASKIGEKRLR